MTPNQRRRVAGMLMERFGVSQRRACRVIGQPVPRNASTPPVPDDEEERLRAWLRDFATRRPRWGWRRAADALRREGWRVNHKRVRRLWRDEGLRVPCIRSRKKPLRGVGIVGAVLSDPTERVVGARLPVRPDRRRADVEAVERRSTNTPASARPSSSSAASTPTRSSPPSTGSRPQRGAPAYLRFDHGPEFIAARGRGLVPVQQRHDRVHRPGLTVAERLDRKLQRSAPRRTPQRRAVRHPPRSPRRDRRLAHRLQQQPTPLQPREAHPDRVRRPLAPTPGTPTPTLIASGPTIGARSDRPIPRYGSEGWGFESLRARLQKSWSEWILISG